MFLYKIRVKLVCITEFTWHYYCAMCSLSDSCLQSTNCVRLLLQDMKRKFLCLKNVYFNLVEDILRKSNSNDFAPSIRGNDLVCKISHILVKTLTMLLAPYVYVNVLECGHTFFFNFLESELFLFLLSLSVP